MCFINVARRITLAAAAATLRNLTLIIEFKASID
jgi:hypothetical protein